MDKILIFSHLGAVQLAVYSLSQLPVSNIRSLFKQVAHLAYPKYAAKTLPEIESTIYHRMAVFTVPLALTVIIYILLAPYFYETLFPKYTEAILYSQISIISLLFFQKKLIAYAVLATASKKHIYTMSIWASVFKIVLLVILLPLYGIWGAIFAELIAQVSGFITSFFMLRRVISEKKNGAS
jgi:O-antigen/teichoic acid export membrane protein